MPRRCTLWRHHSSRWSRSSTVKIGDIYAAAACGGGGLENWAQSRSSNSFRRRQLRLRNERRRRVPCTRCTVTLRRSLTPPARHGPDQPRWPAVAPASREKSASLPAGSRRHRRVPSNAGVGQRRLDVMFGRPSTSSLLARNTFAIIGRTDAVAAGVVIPVTVISPSVDQTKSPNVEETAFWTTTTNQ